jgi:hypothetical protein
VECRLNSGCADFFDKIIRSPIDWSINLSYFHPALKRGAGQMQAATGRSFYDELRRARRHQAITRGVTRVLGAACALIILGVVGAFTLDVLDASVGPFAPVSVSDNE